MMRLFCNEIIWINVFILFITIVGKTTPAESRYSSYELEVLAIIKALKKFHVYLLGIACTIVTDCHVFTFIMSKRTFAYALRDGLYF